MSNAIFHYITQYFKNSVYKFKWNIEWLVNQFTIVVFSFVGTISAYVFRVVTKAYLFCYAIFACFYYINLTWNNYPALFHVTYRFPLFSLPVLSVRTFKEFFINLSFYFKFFWKNNIIKNYHTESYANKSPCQSKGHLRMSGNETF